MTVVPGAITGRVICGAEASKCVCNKDHGHVEAGDDLHECGRRCSGAWTGTWEADDFLIMRLPYPLPPREETR